MSDLPTLDYTDLSAAPAAPGAPPPDSVEEFIEPPRVYTDRMIDARLNGYSWGEVDDFLSDRSREAYGQGYSDQEINDYLGIAPSNQTRDRMMRDAQSRVSDDPEFLQKLNGARPAELTPLEGASAARIAEYSGVDTPLSVVMPASDFVEPPPSGVDLHDSFARNSYARSLFDDAVRSPRDFAERYVGGLLGAAPGVPAGMVRAAGELAASLPSDRDFTDTAIAVAHSSGIAVDADTVKTVRNNLIDKWTDTGLGLDDIRRQAFRDPDFRAELTSEKTPPRGMFGWLLTLPQEQLDAEVQQSTDIGRWVSDLAIGWYDWRMSQPDALRAKGELTADWPSTRDELVKKLREQPLDEEAVNNALGFAGGTIKTIGARFGEAVGLVPSAAEKLAATIEKMPEPRVEIIDPEAAAGTAPKTIPISDFLGGKYRQVADTLQSAAGRIGGIAENLKAKFSQHAAAQMADDIHVGGVQPGIEPIEVWHGSPHDFDRFDISKVGLGEGNQVYGHGIYFAEQRAVGEGYQRRLGEIADATYNGEMGDLQKEGMALVNQSGSSRRWEISPREIRNTLIENYTNTFETMEARAARVAEVLGKPVDDAAVASEKAELGRKIEALKSLNPEKLTDKPGALYKVNLHVDQDKLFDWDAPLSQQPEAVQKVFEKLGLVTKGEDGALVFPQGKGRELLNQLGSNKVASETLQREGLDGIKYLDGGSRASGEGSRNYVIFDDAKMEMLEKNGTPIKPAEVQKQIEAVAEGQKTAVGLIDHFATTFRDLMADESGALKLWSTAQQKLDKQAYRDARVFMQHTIIANEGYGKQMVAWSAHQLDPSSSKLGVFVPPGLRTQSLAAKLDNAHKRIAPHMKEWLDALADEKTGNPMGTQIGKLIDYMQGRSMGYALPHNSDLAPVADTLRGIYKFFENEIQKANAEGVIDMTHFFQDYFPQMWKDPNKARNVVDAIYAVTGKQGSSGHLKQRTHITYSDGLSWGLQPAEPDPLRATMNYVTRMANFLQSSRILKKNIDEGVAYWASQAKDPLNDIKLNGFRVSRAVAPGVEQFLFANRGAANAWNAWVDRGLGSTPNLKSWQEKLLFTKNTMTQLLLANPLFHGMGIGVETSAGGIGNAISEMARGEIGRGVVNYASSQTVIPQITRQIFKGGEVLDKFYNMHPDPAVDALVRGGMQFGPRPHLYRTGKAENYIASLVKGELKADWFHNFSRIVEKDPHGDVALSQIAWRSTEFAGREVGRIATSMTGPMFDIWIPRLKAAAAYERMQTYMRQNPLASEQQVLAKAREIARNTDDRLGEMNLDTAFWPKWVKQTAQIGMLSPTWLYGALRFMSTAAGAAGNFAANVATLGRAGRAVNETALTSMLGFFMASAGINAITQFFMDGRFPWETDTPLRDIASARTGGTNPKTGQPERILTPGLIKEFYDLLRVGMITSVNPWDLGEAVAHYGMNRLSPPPQLLRMFMTGQDAIGHYATAGGRFPEFAAKYVTPIFQGTILNRQRGTNIPEWMNWIGFRQTMPHIEDPEGFIAGRERMEQRHLLDDYRRQVRENQFLETPVELGPEPPAPERAPRSYPGGGHGSRNTRGGPSAYPGAGDAAVPGPRSSTRAPRGGGSSSGARSYPGGM